MSTNENIMLEFYSLGKEDSRATLSRSSSLEFYYTKKHLEGLIELTDRVLEVGCATGHYGMYYSDKCKEYVGVDLVPLHIELFKKRISDSKLIMFLARLETLLLKGYQIIALMLYVLADVSSTGER